MEEFKTLNKIQLLKIIAIIALSDGSINKINKYAKELRLVTHKESVEQHELLNYLTKKIINKKTSVYIGRFLRSSVYCTELINSLLRLSPSFKTTPYRTETKEKFFSQPQPTLKFIFNERKNFQMLAFRLWFDFEGSVIPRFRICKKLDRGYFYYDVAFLSEILLAETNPSLIKDLIKLSKNLGFKAVVKKDRRKWIGIDGIRIYKKDNILKFTKFGPITNVKVSNKSPRFSGFSKRSLCLATQEILKWKKIHWSFKNKKEAMILKRKLDKKLRSIIKKYDN